MGQPGVLTREEQVPLSAEEAWPLLEKALGGALALMVERRETEGAALAQELGGLREALAGHVDTVARRAPAAVERRAARLRERMQTMLGDAQIDPARLATEVAVWADRTDVSEELARLRAHLAQLGRAPGRRRAGGADARLPDPGDQPGGEHGRLQGGRPGDLPDRDRGEGHPREDARAGAEHRMMRA